MYLLKDLDDKIVLAEGFWTKNSSIVNKKFQQDHLYDKKKAQKTAFATYNTYKFGGSDIFCNILDNKIMFDGWEFCFYMHMEFEVLVLYKK